MRSNIPHNTQLWYLQIHKDILENAEYIILCKIKVDSTNKKNTLYCFPIWSYIPNKEYHKE